MEVAPVQHLMLLLVTVVGSIQVWRQLLLFAKWTWQTFLRPGKKLSGYGSWALVTGATDGIGRAFCMQLARQKINIVLVGRSSAKVEEVTKELTTKYGVQVRSALIDFAEEDLASVKAKIESAISGLEVGILVNNLGMSYPWARFFHEVDADLTRNLLRFNVEVPMQLIQLVLPEMLKRKRGAIVNIGSGSASCLPSDPLYAVYAATKAFLDQLSRTLYVEYKDKGIDVQCQVPLYVATKMSKIRRASLFVPSATGYAYCALRWIGQEPRCTPYWVHSVMWWVMCALPEYILDSIRMRMSLKVRRRGMAKEASSKKD